MFFKSAACFRNPPTLVEGLIDGGTLNRTAFIFLPHVESTRCGDVEQRRCTVVAKQGRFNAISRAVPASTAPSASVAVAVGVKCRLQLCGAQHGRKQSVPIEWRLSAGHDGLWHKHGPGELDTHL